MKPHAVLVVFVSLVLLTPALALTHLSEVELVQKSDLVALGEVVGVDQGVDSTSVQIKLSQVLKGSQEPGDLVTVESFGGKVYVDEDEPSWSPYKVGLYFLHKTASGGILACVNKADGQKRIFGENIFPYHENITLGVPLKDYLKSLESAVRSSKQR